MDKKDRVIDYSDFLNYCPNPNQDNIVNPIEVFVRVNITPNSWETIEQKRRDRLAAKYQDKFNSLIKEMWMNNFDVYIPGHPDVSLEGGTVKERDIYG